MVHQRVLAKSPVLARMTTGGFSESITKEIILPEDDEDAFGRIIEFLYDNEHDAFDFSSLNESESIAKLANMFALADKYDLPNLQKTIITKLEDVKLMKKKPMTIFNTAYQIDQNSGDSYGFFRSFFAKNAGAHLKSLTAAEFKTLLDMVESEESFTKWIFVALAELYRQDHNTWIDEKKALTATLKSTEADLENVRKMRSKFEAGLEGYGRRKSVSIQWIRDLLAQSES